MRLQTLLEATRPFVAKPFDPALMTFEEYIKAVNRKGEWHDLYSVAILKREFDALPTASEFINAVCPVDTTPNIDINFQDYI
jgi:hypothetical protein